jgi:hypothetical protein
MNTTNEVQRTISPTVTAIATRSACFEIASGQTFANTTTAWEIWQKSPPLLLRKIPRSRVLWVFENESLEGFFRHCMPPRKKIITTNRRVRSK